MTISLLLLPAITGLCILLVVVYRILFSPLRGIPGPFLARITDGWYAWRITRGEFEKENIALHKKYGPIVRYGPNRISISHPTSSVIYSLGQPTFPKSSWYTSSSPPGKWNLFTDTNPSHHGLTRRQFQSAYSMSALMQYEPQVDACADIFCTRMLELAHAGMPDVDMRHWFACYAFDVVSCMTYSKRMGFLDQGKDVSGVMREIDLFLVYSTLVGIYAALHWICFPLLQFIGGLGSNGQAKGAAFLVSFSRQRMDEHQKGNVKAVGHPEEENEMDGKDDFLTKFLARHRAKPTEFTPHHVLIGCVGNLAAGGDTTAISLSAVLYYLLRNPDCLAKLRAEVDQIKGTHISFKQSLDMPYLQAVIKEGLRMHPATGLPLERVVPEGGATIAGKFLPADTTVGVNTWVEHYDEQLWEDAAVFRPERWLDADEEKVKGLMRHWIPFGLGSRTCIGRHISMLEMSKLIPRMVRDFDFELAGGLQNRAWKTTNWWFVKPNDFVVRIRQRGTPAE